MFKYFRSFRKRTALILAALVALYPTIDVLAKIYQALNLSISSQLRAEKNAEISQLSSYANFGQLLKEYRRVQPSIKNLKNEFQQRFGFDKNPKIICQILIRTYKNGESIYYSKDFSDYKKIHDFFETLGLLLDRGIIDFDLVFQLFTFPGNFPEGEYPIDHPNSNPLISIDECVESNWFKENDPLRGFGSHVKQLGYNYNYARLKLKRDTSNDPTTIKTYNIKMEKLKNNQCIPFYPLDPPKPSWIKIYPGQYNWNDINKYWNKC